MTPAELASQRRITGAFIAANPILISLTPLMKSRTPTGGMASGAGTPRTAQTMRLVEQGSGASNSPGAINGADGTSRRVVFMLLGNWDAVMDVGDFWFDAAGARLEIAELLPDNGYERRARVVRYG